MSAEAIGAESFSLDDEHRETIRALAESLIPKHSSGPSASEAGVPDEYIDEVLNLRPDRVEAFLEIVHAAGGADPRAFCRTLEAERPADFQLLTFIIAGAYFMSPRARAWLGYEGQLGESVDVSVQPEYEAGGLLDAVLARGAAYRTTGWVPGRGK